MPVFFLGGNMSKYKNKKMQFGDLKFDSILEYEYFLHLTQQQELGLIKGFKMQVPYVLIPSYEVNGKKRIGVKYKPDFIVEKNDGTLEFIDVKGMVNDKSILTRKIFENKYSCELKFVCHSKIDGGWILWEDLKKARKQRKLNKTNKI